MTDLFFFGSLRDAQLLERVLGRAVDPACIVAATAPGRLACALEEQAYPYLAEMPGSWAEGVVVTGLNADDMDRLEYYEEAEYGLAPLDVECGGQMRRVQYFHSTPKVTPRTQPWDFAAWQRDEKAVAIEAAIELMAHKDVVPVEQMDTIWPGIMIRARMRARARAETPVTGTLRADRAPGDVVSERVGRPYTAYFALEQHRLRHRRFDGTMSEPVERTVLTSGDAVTIVPFDPATGQVMLIEQFRAPMFARGDACPWGIEAIAGRIDQENDAEACARREAEEEGGIALGAVEAVAQYYSTPGIASEHITSFVGHAKLAGEGGVFGVAHEHEDIRAFTCSLDQALAGVASGEINNAPAILSLLWLGQNRERLAAAWG